MRRPALAAFIYLCAGPIALADFGAVEVRPPAHHGPSGAPAELSEGMLVPMTTPLSDIPPSDRDGYGTYDGYRFAVVSGHGAIVDPHTRRVIGILR